MDVEPLHLLLSSQAPIHETFPECTRSRLVEALELLLELPRCLALLGHTRGTDRPSCMIQT